MGFFGKQRSSTSLSLNQLIKATKGTVQEKLKIQKHAYLESIKILEQLEETCSLISILNYLHEQFEAGTIGANSTTKEQIAGIKSYYIIRDALPDHIRDFLLPGHIFHPGDPECISSSRTYFKQQIDRLGSFVTPKNQIIGDDNFAEVFWQLEETLKNLFPQKESKITQEHPFQYLENIAKIEQQEVSMWVPGSQVYTETIFTAIAAEELIQNSSIPHASFWVHFSLLINDYIHMGSNSPITSELPYLNTDREEDFSQFTNRLKEKIKQGINLHIESVKQDFFQTLLNDWRDYRDNPEEIPLIFTKLFEYPTIQKKIDKIRIRCDNRDSKDFFNTKPYNNQLKALITNQMIQNILLEFIDTHPEYCLGEMLSALQLDGEPLYFLRQGRDGGVYIYPSLKHTLIKPKLFLFEDTYGIMKI